MIGAHDSAFGCKYHILTTSPPPTILLQMNKLVLRCACAETLLQLAFTFITKRPVADTSLTGVMARESLAVEAKVRRMSVFCLVARITARRRSLAAAQPCDCPVAPSWWRTCRRCARCRVATCRCRRHQSSLSGECLRRRVFSCILLNITFATAAVSHLLVADCGSALDLCNVSDYFEKSIFY